MTFLVDTSVWSLALRRDQPVHTPEVEALRDALKGAQLVLTTGIILQEILQGALREDTRRSILERFGRLAFVMPELDDHVAAAQLRATCKARGVQLGTVDALIAQLCIRNGVTLLTADADFRHAARYSDLRVWTGSSRRR